MTFGLITGVQVALLAAAVVVAILTIFFLRVRHPRVTVPSLLLWRQLLKERRRDSLMERLRRLISLAIALAVGLLLVLALGEPARPGASETRLALLVDNSASMNALMPDGRTRLDHALDAARLAIDDAPPAARFQVADTTGRLLTGADLDRAAALQALDGITPRVQGARAPALAEHYTVLVFTDALGFQPPSGARLVPVDGPDGNVAITAFELREVPAGPLQYEAFVSIVNFDGIQREVALTIGPPGVSQLERKVRLEPGGELTEIVEVSQLAPGPVEARIVSAGDVLPLDDRAYAWMPARERWRVLLVTPGSDALTAALRADPRVSLEIVRPDNYRPYLAADVVVFDRFVPDGPPERPALVVQPPPGGWLRAGAEPLARPVLLPRAMGHPVADALSFDDVRVERAFPLNPAGGETLIADARTGSALVSAGADSAPWIAVGLALEDSNLPSHRGFPLFLAAALTWLHGPSIAIDRTPGLVELPIADAEIVDADGRQVPSYSLTGSTRFEAPAPGLFFAMDHGRRTAVAVNFSDRTVSNLSAPPRIDLPSTTAIDAGRTSWPLWVWLAAGAAMLLVVEWWTWNKRLTV